MAPALPGGYGGGTWPLAIAHRGGAGLGVENTVETFARSVSLGFDYLETDVRVTSDGVLVAFHDDRLSRVTDLRGRIERTPWSVLRQARVRTSLGDDGRVHPLADLLEAFPDSKFAIDLKSTAAIAPLAKVLRDTRSQGRVCLAGAWDGWLSQARALIGPQLVTALGWRSLGTLVSCAKAGVRPPARVATGQFVHVPVSLGRVPVLAERLVTVAHDLGLRLVAWTVDDPARMRSLLDLGVDGIITDRPDVLREVLVARGQWRLPSAA
jgi:glycerophosphoryl diester phosphodiesterase